MDPQLRAVVGDLQAASHRLRTLQSRLPRQSWSHRPGATRWSAAECVAHLNLTSRALLPALRAALEEASRVAPSAAMRYRRDVVGWLVWKLIAPSSRLRTRTIPAFVPSVERSPEALVSEFEQLQLEIISCVRAADGLPIDRVTLVSPFDRRLTFNLYAGLTLVPRHQLRHLAQAEQASGMSAREPFSDCHAGGAHATTAPIAQPASIR